MTWYELGIRVSGKDAGGTRVLGDLRSALGGVLKIAGGVALGNALSRIGRGMGDMAKGAISAASQTQNLNIALGTLVARQAVAAGAFDNISEAIDQVGGNVKALMGDLRSLSLISPFEREMVESTFKFNMAFGATSEMAKNVTKASLDAASALGLTNEMFNRMSYNLAQAVIAGDLTSANLRQLKMVGLDLADVFRSELGLSIEQVREQLKSGKMTMEDVANAFVQYTDENFGGAAARMSKTFTGMLSSMRDLFSFSASDLLTPSITRISEAMSGLFDSARGVLDSGVLSAIGDELGKLTGAAIDAGKAFVSKFGGRMAQAAANAFVWGVNISTELASGIIQGAVSALVAAMNFISGLLSSWLGPGSPPKVASDIDKWGAAAMGEFLRGFTEADWGVMDTVGRAIEGVMGTLVDLGTVAKDALGPTMAKISMDLARALDTYNKTGKVSENIFKRLREAGGQFGADLEKLARAQFSLVDATKQYEATQKALKTAQENVRRETDAVSRLKAEYNELVATRAPMREVRAKKAALEAAEARLKAAEAEKSEAEKAQDAAKERMELLRQQVRWQEKLLRQMQQMFRWQKKVTKEEEKAGGGGGGGGRGRAGRGGGVGGLGGLGGIALPKPSFTPILEGAAEALAPSPLVERIKSVLSGAFDELKTSVEGSLTELGGAWDNFVGTLKQVWDEKGAGITEGLKKFIPDDLAEKIGKVAGVALTASIAFKALGVGLGIVKWALAPILGPLKAVGGALLVLGTLPAVVIAAFAGLVLALLTNFAGIRDGIGRFSAGFRDFFLKKLPEIVQGFSNKLVEKLNEAGQWLVDKWNEIKDNAVAGWEAIKDGIGLVVDALRMRIQEIIYKVITWLIEKWQAIKDKAKELWGKIRDAVVDKVTEMRDWIVDKILKLRDWLSEQWEKVKDLFSGAWEKIKNAVKGPIDTIIGWIQNIIDKVKEGLDWLGRLAQGTEAGQWKPPGPGSLPSPGDFGDLFQHGGYVPRNFSANEIILPLSNRTGINALSKAITQAMGGQQAMPTLVIQGDLIVQAQDADDLLDQLQAFSVPNVGI